MQPFLGFGVGLRPQHYSYVIENNVSVDWFEIISENFMGLMHGGNWGRHMQYLEKIRSKFPMVMHGVSLSIGSVDPVNVDYLKRLKALADCMEPAWVSDHLCWTGVNGENLHDLLPLPYTVEAIEHVSEKLQQVQEHLKRPLVLENVSAYLSFTHSEMSEWEFIAEITKRTGCQILLDINNVYVSSVNNKFNAIEYLNGIPKESVKQFHLAGHSDCGTHLIDTHDNFVCDEVWKLYEVALSRFRNVSTLIEWDAHIPEFFVLEEEVAKARTRYQGIQKK